MKMKLLLAIGIGLLATHASAMSVASVAHVSVAHVSAAHVSAPHVSVESAVHAVTAEHVTAPAVAAPIPSPRPLPGVAATPAVLKPQDFSQPAAHTPFYWRWWYLYGPHHECRQDTPQEFDKCVHK
jgi:hypothetical protein